MSYLKAISISYYQPTAAMAITQFVSLLLLTLTCGSMLPRLIHADHVSTVSRDVVDATDSNDVEGLAALQRSFIVLQSFKGDPCFEFDSPWSWVECSNDTPARITALSLWNAGLSGPIPDFSSMDALQSINFSLNFYLNGTIPDFLGTLPHLTSLDLSFNDFSGKVPATVINNKKLATEIDGNPKLSTSGDTLIGIPDNDQQPYYISVLNKKSNNNSKKKSNNNSKKESSNKKKEKLKEKEKKKKKKSKTGAIVGISISVFVIAVIVLSLWLWLNHKKRKAEALAEANTAAAGKEAMGSEMGGKLV